MAARTAVISGTATAVSGRVAHRQAAAYQQAAAPQVAAPQQPVAAPAAAPVPTENETTGRLRQLAQLHSQGVLTDEEFAAAKAKVLGI